MTKKTIVFMFVLFFVQYSSCQKKTPPRIKGNVLKSTETATDSLNGKFFLKEVRTLFYNADGFLKETILDTLPSFGYHVKELSKEVRYYNEEELLRSIIFWGKDTFACMEYRYDYKGRTTEESIKDTKSLWKYQYDDKDRLVRETLQGAGKLNHDYRYVYEKENAYRVTSYDSTGKILLVKLGEVEKYPNGELAKVVQRSLQGDTLSMTSYKYRYDDKGNRIEKTERRYDGHVITTRWDIVYEEKNK